jgi:hypothetical protein
MSQITWNIHDVIISNALHYFYWEKEDENGLTLAAKWVYKNNDAPILFVPLKYEDQS